MKLMTVVLMLFLAGCTTFGAQEVQRYYVLGSVPSKISPAASPRTATLVIAPTTVSGFYETEEIAYSRAPGMRAYYQLHAWTDRPGRRLPELLSMRLEQAGLFKSVTPGIGVQGDFELSTHLAELYHDAASVPGNSRIVMTAELRDPVKRTVLAKRTFEKSAPLPSYDAPGAVQAFNAALTEMLDDIAAWVDASLPR